MAEKDQVPIDRVFERMLPAYQYMEPDGADNKWNPLGNDTELWHRTRIFTALKWGLSQLDMPIAEAKILDVGCGAGRSTRALLEFGAKPENLLGIDLRESALAYAQSVNPAIPVRLVRGFDDWPLAGSFHLCMQCTAFSSIQGIEGQRALAEMMEKVVCDKGYIFWWDRVHACEFAGGDLLEPRTLFKQSRLLGYRLVSLPPSFIEASRRGGRRLSSVFWLFQKLLGFPPTHCAALFAKK